MEADAKDGPERATPHINAQIQGSIIWPPKIFSRERHNFENQTHTTGVVHKSPGGI